MNPRLFLLLGVGVGYLLGTRAGRERYDSMKDAAVRLWGSPAVSQARTDLAEYARQQAPLVRARVEGVARTAPGAIADATQDVAARSAAVARTASHKVAVVAGDVKVRVVDSAAELTERAADSVERVALAAGRARDDAMDSLANPEFDDDAVAAPATGHNAEAAPDTPDAS